MRGWKSSRELAWRGLVHAVAGGTISGNDWLSWKRAKHLPRPFSSGQTERRDRRRRASRRGASRRWPATRRRRQQDQYRPRESVPRSKAKTFATKRDPRENRLFDILSLVATNICAFLDMYYFY